MIDRERLTNIIEEEGKKNWWNPRGFEEYVREQLPSELKVVSVPPSPSGNYNCFVYALGLENDSEFLGGQNPIQKEFIRHLLSKDILGIKEIPIIGDLIFYEDSEGDITHGGIVRTEDIILSKWMWGALFLHKTWDVPSSFGDKVFYTNRPDPTTVKEEYERYKDSGVEIRPIS